MAEAGILRADERVELLDGQVFTKAVITPRDAACVHRLSTQLHTRTPDTVDIRRRYPVRLDAYSEPEPDLVLLRERADDYPSAPPDAADVLLLVEVVDGPSDHERVVKLPLYARCGIPEVWLVGLAQGHVVVCSEPTPVGFRVVDVARPNQTLRPLALGNLLVDLPEVFG